MNKPIRKAVRCYFDERYNFKMYIKVDEEENILSVDYNLEEM